MVQTPKDERYEGYFNAANYHVFTAVCVILIQCGMSMYNYGGFASKAWKYLGFPGMQPHPLPLSFFLFFLHIPIMENVFF